MGKDFGSMCKCPNRKEAYPVMGQNSMYDNNALCLGGTYIPSDKKTLRIIGGAGENTFITCAQYAITNTHDFSTGLNKHIGENMRIEIDQSGYNKNIQKDWKEKKLKYKKDMKKY